MSATKCLRDEHRVILRVLDAFEVALRQAHTANVQQIALKLGGRAQTWSTQSAPRCEPS